MFHRNAFHPQHLPSHNAYPIIMHSTYHYAFNHHACHNSWCIQPQCIPQTIMHLTTMHLTTMHSINHNAFNHDAFHSTTQCMSYYNACPNVFHTITIVHPIILFFIKFTTHDISHFTQSMYKKPIPQHPQVHIQTGANPWQDQTKHNPQYNGNKITNFIQYRTTTTLQITSIHMPCHISQTINHPTQVPICQ